jgi:hypothetical protein
MESDSRRGQGASRRALETIAQPPAPLKSDACGFADSSPDLLAVILFEKLGQQAAKS